MSLPENDNTSSNASDHSASRSHQPPGSTTTTSTIPPWDHDVEIIASEEQDFDPEQPPVSALASSFHSQQRCCTGAPAHTSPSSDSHPSAEGRKVLVLDACIPADTATTVKIDQDTCFSSFNTLLDTDKMLGMIMLRMPPLGISLFKRKSKDTQYHIICPFGNNIQRLTTITSLTHLFSVFDKHYVLQLEMHEAAKLALNDIPQFTGKPPSQHQYSIYTDGSLPVSQEQAAWSGFILGSHSGILAFHGLVTNLVSQSGIACAQAAPSSTPSECAGLLWMLLWVMAHELSNATFLVDSKSTIGFADGMFHADGAGQLPQLLAMLFKFYASKSNVTVKHVKAHSNDPWNELAD